MKTAALENLVLDELDEALNRPHVYRKAGADWLSTKQWSLEYFKKNYSSETIYVIDKPDSTLIGEDLERKKYIEMVFGDFIAKVESGEMTRDNYCYMIQSDLLENNKSLQDQYTFPPIFSQYEMEDYLWVSPDVAVTPLHFDSEHILSYQVTGSKKFTFYSPDNPGKFYRLQNDPKLAHLSMINPYDVDREVFPGFPETPDYEFTLEPGDILYIPPKWWHHVISKEVSVSVTRNWTIPKD